MLLYNIFDIKTISWLHSKGYFATFQQEFRDERTPRAGGGIGEFQTGNTEEKAGTAQGPGREIRVQASEGVERSGELQKSSEKAEFFLYNRGKL